MARSPQRRRSRSRSRSRSRLASPRARRSRWQSPRRESARRSRSRSHPRSRSRSRSASPARRRRDNPRDRRDAEPGTRRGGPSPPPPRAQGGGKKPRDFTHLIKWGKQEEEEAAEGEQEPEQPVEKPNFGLSGALAKDQATGNVQNGVVLKWSEPPEARRPAQRYRLYVFKKDALIETLHVHRKSAFLVGRDKAVADILTEHESCSKQHAVLQYRLFQRESADGLDVLQEVRPYVMDLNSTNGTRLNGRRIDGARYVELRVKDVLQFGDSTREYVLMDAS